MIDRNNQGKLAVPPGARRSCPADIKLVGFDVDGVFTDGRFYLGDNGVETKAFHTQDGFGIRQLLTTNIQVAVISGRHSLAVEKRMKELGVRFIFQDCKDKIGALESVAQQINVTLTRCAYVGDDIPDLPLLRRTGFSVAVANAVPAVKSECDFITTASGGAGAVREVCEHVLAAAAPWPTQQP